MRRLLIAMVGLVVAGGASGASLSAADVNGASSPVYSASDVISVEVKLDGSGLPGTGSIQRMAFHAFWTSNLDVVSVTYETILPGYYWLAGPDHGTVDGNLLYTSQYDQGDWGGQFYDQLIATLVFHVLNEDSPTATIYVGFIEILGDGIWGGLDDGFPNLTPHFLSTTDAVIQIAPESSTCGDGVIEDAETCDDAGTGPGDGCDASCQIEEGWICTGEPSVCSADCGDGLIVGSEECDDSGTTTGDGCDAICQIESGWICAGEPSVCALCGDGLIESPEACDDGGITPGDGCDASCQIEEGWICAGEPSTCTEHILPTLSPWSQLALVAGLLGAGLGVWRWRNA